MGRRAIQVVVAFAAACAVATPAAAKPAGGLSRAHARHLAAAKRSALDFSWPAEGTITTPFTPYHHGLDIGMLRSLEVRAAAPGKVVSVGYATGFEGYGNIVLVQVTPDVVTLYAHLSSYKVHPGEAIARGELLGIAGCTGYCTGVHLHFEVRQNGVAVDPRKFLSGG
ncbi:MAG TPA: M23 family metallopeptidase [Gaiellaceae bacterium]|jgi:murein DD-endopeptidase MepM/ murein hydrolase activator NlpD